MSTLVSLAPSGFLEAVGLIGKLPATVFEILTVEVIDFVLYKSAVLSQTRIEKAYPSENKVLSGDELQSVINAVTYLYRAFARDNMALDAVGTVLQELSIPTEHLTLLAKTWKSRSASVNEGIQRLLSVGTLVDMQWKVGVAVQSSNCEALRSPYVSIVLKVADSDGKVHAHPFELTVPEFQAFARQISSIEETLSGY
eukprot:TRINITY_DN1783_c0_g1_i1.p1 TRINITY_DN1783_c0_g1~~TRINITY_DN1783_c0_g1_i1.p1  ORF type:complete len:198 (+),score=40.08 TRINITY_DN1783_c0_g1_i1:50-643(+)